MQHMPDKEFDNLFRDKFENAEIEPSTNLWANIEKELEPKKKRTFPIYWLAAATIAIAFTAVLVLQKKDVKYMHGSDPIAQVTPVAPIDTVATPDEVQTTSQAAKPMVARTGVKADKVQPKQEEAPKTPVIENNLQNNQIAVQPPNPIERLPIKQQDPKPINVLPIKEAQANPVVIAQAAPKTEDNVIKETETVSERKGIRNVGDLVNYVVDKVDKRDKKLVRFNTDDDDNSSLIGINIGFLKLNKKNKDQK
jgi:hypothetical protein